MFPDLDVAGGADPCRDERIVPHSIIVFDDGSAPEHDVPANPCSGVDKAAHPNECSFSDWHIPADNGAGMNGRDPLERAPALNELNGLEACWKVAVPKAQDSMRDFLSVADVVKLAILPKDG